MATYYTSSAASGGGTGAIDDEFTLQELADTMTSSDLGLIKADGTYTPTATIDWDYASHASTIDAFVNVRGCASDGTDDGTVATISGASISAAPIFNINQSTICLSIKNLRFTAGTDDLGSVLESDCLYVAFRNCRFDSSTDGSGFYSSDSAAWIRFYDCEFDNNTDYGSTCSGSNRGRGNYIRCSVHDNALGGVLESQATVSTYYPPIFSQCLIYSNGSTTSHHGLSITQGSSDGHSIVENCTFYDNGGTGLYLNGEVELIVIRGCIFESNGAYGIYFATLPGLLTLEDCTHYQNTSGPDDLGGGSAFVTGSGHIYETANFVGATNLTPQNTALETSFAFPAGGTTYGWIGAIQPQDSAAPAGGGLLTHPGMSGGMRG